MVFLKKFLMALAIALYSVVPVVASDNDRVSGHWQGQGAKMLKLKVHQQTARGHLKKAHLEGMWASVQDIRLAKKRLRISFQSSGGKEGLISRYKREYQISVGRKPHTASTASRGRFPANGSVGVKANVLECAKVMGRAGEKAAIRAVGKTTVRARTKVMGRAGEKAAIRAVGKTTVRARTNVMAWAGTNALGSVGTNRAVTSGRRIGKRNHSTPINTMTLGVSPTVKAPLRRGFLCLENIGQNVGQNDLTQIGLARQEFNNYAKNGMLTRASPYFHTAGVTGSIPVTPTIFDCF